MPPLSHASPSSTQSCPVITPVGSDGTWHLHRGTYVLLLVLSLTALVAAAPRLCRLLFPPLPAYTVRVHSDRQCTLCGAASSDQGPITADLPLAIDAVPTSPVTGPVFLHLYVGDGHSLRRSVVWAERSSHGSLHLRGLAREILDLRSDDEGRRELWLLIDRSPLSPSPDTLREQATTGAAGSSPLLRVPIVLQRR